ncbi:copper resistance protein NlpE N-terminal domain-containing protein [Flavihumibacter stibioxidans]|uniref:DUF306 domain-containing protein n=1 Tax=Flavihumibacter stibioxidans TaxID=1834163 RepID=A0ABR7M6G0_9BACT|nr:copper resistance protein NlpE N-terminal domain-containing protein [Flavihumibacter stibioxidans]MBC6490547.1 hypothetical protein [Flavihumibacter stibioxidans]
MKKTLLFTAISQAVLVFTGCKTTHTPAVTGDNSMTSLDWSGTYSGILPCADCDGIETLVQLNPDKTYTLKRKYLGKSDKVYSGSGTFSWNKEGSRITLSGDKPGIYQVGENKLVHLDGDGNKITGQLAEKYLLMKQLNGLTEKYWKLTELMGKPVTKSATMAREPHLILRTEGNRVNAHGGCNSLMGTYELMPENRISFGQMAGTLMACPDMTVEDQLKKVLEMADNYNLDGDKLVLNRAKMAPLARFEAVYLR